MGEKKVDILVADAPLSSLTSDEYDALPADVKRQYGLRALEKFKALQGKVHLNIDIDELRGRNRR